MSEYQLDNPPLDGISAIKFSPQNSQYLIASSWDHSVRLYDVTNNRLLNTFNHAAAVLDCCMVDTNKAYSGGLDRILKSYDFSSQKETIIGRHEDSIKCVHYSQELNIIITGSWDKQVKLWDARMPNCISIHDHGEKVFTLDTCEEKLVVGTDNRRIRIWNLKNMQVPEQSRDSSLRYQTRCIRCFPNKQGFALSSIEGRVAVEYFDMNSEIQKKKYAFKCHRSKTNDTELIYPVNAISFHNMYNTFATGGSDGMVNIWDGFNKKRLCQFHPYPAGITSLAFNHTGNLIAIAASYNYERGQLQQGQPKDEIYIRRVSDLETKPK